MCVKHIVENLKKNHANKYMLKTLVWKLAWSNNEKEYAANLNNLRCYDDALYNDVMREEPHTWSRCFYKLGSCCEDVDNNTTESFNSNITKARAKSLVPMLETIRRQGMTRIVKRNKKSLKHQGRYSKYALKILASEKIDADRCTVYRCTHGIFEVYLDGNGNRVEIPKTQCSCGKWQITGIPCEHAYAAMLEAGFNAEGYISGYFETDLWRGTYETTTFPLRGPKYWMDSTYRLVVAPPPPVPGRKKGSKKKVGMFARIKGKNESPKKKKNEVEKLGRRGKVIHCKSCGEAGHNALGCKKFPKEKVPWKRKAKTAGIDELQAEAKKAKKDNKAKEKEKQTKKPNKTKKEKKTQGQETISITQPSQATQE